ncbi:MAG: aspartate/glutamate racemase family protein [Motiliproteus sp.]
MKDRTLLGVLTPSSNTVLEPITASILADLPDVSSHFGRLRVTEISLSDTALKQFDSEPFLEASRLLADAKVQAIVWSGTSSGWRGFQDDEAVCRAIRQETGIEATTSVLALNEAFVKKGIKNFGLVTPYLSDVQQKILHNYAQAGFNCVAERHLNDRGNFSFSEYGEEQIEQMVRQVAAEGKCDAITIFCTNMRGARVAAELEKELNIPIYDSVSTGVWKSMLIADQDPSRIKGWGSLFDLV